VKQMPDVVAPPPVEKVLKAYVFIESEKPQPFRWNLYKKKYFVTDGWIKFRYGKHQLEVPSGTEFDGPSIPRIFWGIVGLSPLDDDALLASCAHDWVCDNPDEMPRVMGDALFVSCLGPIIFNGESHKGVRKCRRRAMYLAVRGWTTYMQWKAGE
jgi:hypothetical protein